MHTFADDEGGPPEPLLKLFLGVRETQDPGGGQPPTEHERPPVVRVLQEVQSPPPRSATSVSATSSTWSDYGTDAGSGPDIYEDPQRPLICAFNYPAVTLTLGRQRWPELRDLYLSLALEPTFKIRRTLAASLGEIANIVGEEHAAADLMTVFWSSLHAEEGEVRMKVIEALQTFARAIALPERTAVANGLADAFASGKLSSWREREGAVKALGGLVELEGVSSEVLQTMLVKALEDPVAAVREAAILVVSAWDISIPAKFRCFTRNLALAACVLEGVEGLSDPTRSAGRRYHSVRRLRLVPPAHDVCDVHPGDAYV